MANRKTTPGGSLEPCARVLIAGTQSGVGKTSITLAFIRALSRRGFSVQPYKVGPDFLDPTYLTKAAGRPCFNLDTWMCGPEYVHDLFERTCRDADIAVIEGVMGLFDGADPDSNQGSTAEVAQLLGAPVVLICDAHGQARSLAATVKGFTEFEPEVELRGVIANRCGSERHLSLLRKALQSAFLPPLIGGIQKGALATLQSRHLGLVTADDRSAPEAELNQLADAFESSMSTEAILKLANRAPLIAMGAGNTEIKRESKEPLRLGIASDTAFHFYYPDNLQALRESGFELVFFSPLSDPALPKDLDGLYIGGGYPELFAEALSDNRSMRESIGAFCRTDRPVYAECGGLIYLGQSIIDSDGTDYPMVGVLPSRFRMRDRIKTLGYADVHLRRDSLWGPLGTRLKGHEFHYSKILTPPATDSDWQMVYNVCFRNSEQPVKEGYQRGNILASYVHLHLASNPGCIAHFTRLCRTQSTQRREGPAHANV